MTAQSFDSTEAEALGFYVYLYTDPRNEKPFYVGKGKGNRAFSHLKDTSEHGKALRIREIISAGLQPRIEILAFDLDEQTAFKVEAAAIDLVGFENLTNRVIGQGARRFGRRSIDAVHAELAASPLTEFHHRVAIIRINSSVDRAKKRLGARFDGESDESAVALYDATRGTWVIDKAKADAVEYVLAYYEGVIREVYKVAQWLPGGSTLYADRSLTQEPNRWEFIGRVADEPVRKLYRLRSAAHLFKQGDVNPVRYFG